MGRNRIEKTLLDAKASVLEAKGITKRYPSGEGWTDALRDVSLGLRPGEFVALMGPSGCGKSTLLHIAGGLIPPTAGSMRLASVDLATLSDRELARFRRDHLGLVLQIPNLVPGLTVAENIGLPLLLAGQPIEAHRDRVLDMAEVFGLRGRESQPPARLSAGEQQRVALARALIMRPPIVLIDEPTGNLDYTTGREVLQLLWESCVNLGHTTLLATDDLLAARYADRVCFMRDGTLLDELILGRQEDHTDVGPILARLQKLHL